MKTLTDKEITKGMVVKVSDINCLDVGNSSLEKIKSNHMIISDSEYCSICKIIHYRANFINTGSHVLYRTYTINAFQLVKANV